MKHGTTPKPHITHHGEFPLVLNPGVFSAEKRPVKLYASQFKKQFSKGGVKGEVKFYKAFCFIFY
jgi:hypothetical protein